MTKVYARCPEGVNVSYLTAGKLYEVDDEGIIFTMLSDDGQEISAMWEYSAHLDGLNWQRVELPDDADQNPADTRAKRIQAEAENMVEVLRDVYEYVDYVATTQAKEVLERIRTLLTRIDGGE